MLSLLFVAGTAWAVAIAIDGQVGDWAGVTPSVDAAGDTTSGQAGIDLLRQYTTTHLLYGYIRVDVADLQNPPVANAGSATLLEDGSTTITLTGSDPASQPLTFQIASSPTKGTLGPIVPVNATSATVQYTANANQNGSDSFTFKASNGTQTSAPATVSITITPVNDVPSFSAANPPAVNEGAGPQSIPGWATFNPGPANESSQAVLAYHVSSISNPALFAAGPAVATNGTLTYTLAADASGTSTFNVAVQDNGGTANGGVDSSATQTFTITANAVNDAPSFTGGGNVSALEDAGAQSVAGWATAINDGDPDQVQTLTFQVTGNTNGALFASGPSVDAATGNLTYTPTADANGSATVTLVLKDNGGTANGGVDTSAPYNFQITITPVNDAPSFTAANSAGGERKHRRTHGARLGHVQRRPRQRIRAERAPVFRQQCFESVAVHGGARGRGQRHAELHAGRRRQRQLDLRRGRAGQRRHRQRRRRHQRNADLHAHRERGQQRAELHGGGNVSVTEDAGAQTVPGWATAINDGDPNETQTLTFTVTGNDNPSLFAAGPAVNASNGDLTFTPAADASGSAQITLVLSDDGGIANGGADTSPPYVFTITVTAVNDAPTVTAPPALPVHAHIAISVADGGTGDLLTPGNVSDADGPPPYVIATPTATSSANGGQVAINAATGAFTYNPPAGFTGNDSFSYAVCDSAPTPACSGNVTVTLNVAGRKIWFADAAAAPGGNGTLQSPLATLAAANSAAASGDAIFLFAGTYTGTTLGARPRSGRAGGRRCQLRCGARHLAARQQHRAARGRRRLRAHRRRAHGRQRQHAARSRARWLEFHCVAGQRVRHARCARRRAHRRRHRRDRAH